MSTIGDIGRIAPKPKEIGSSLLRIGLSNLNGPETMGAIAAIIIGAILAPVDFKSALSSLADQTENTNGKKSEPNVPSDRTHGHGGRSKEKL